MAGESLGLPEPEGDGRYKERSFDPVSERITFEQDCRGDEGQRPGGRPKNERYHARLGSVDHCCTPSLWFMEVLRGGMHYTPF